MSIYFGLNLGIGYYKYEVDGIKERRIIYQDFTVQSDKTIAVKGDFKKDLHIFLLQTMLFGRLSASAGLQFIGLVTNHYNYNIKTTHEHLTPKKFIKYPY
jgi:hypothetical protein